MLTNVLRMTLLGALSLPLAFAQTDVARITGTVTDASRAVIPAAVVVLKNEKTGQERKFSTDEHGVYLALQLQPSLYSLSASAPGMATARIQRHQSAGGAGTRPQYPAVPFGGDDRGQRDRRRTGHGRCQFGAHRRQRFDSRSGRAADERPPGLAALPAGARRRQQRQRHLRQHSLQRTLQPAERDPLRRRGRLLHRRQFAGQPERRKHVALPPGTEPGKRPGIPRRQQQLPRRIRHRAPAGRSASSPSPAPTISTDRPSNTSATTPWMRATSSTAPPRANCASISSAARWAAPSLKDKAFFFASYEGLRQKTASPIVESTLSAAVRARPDCTGGNTANCIAPAIRPLLGAFPMGQFASADPLLDIVNISAPSEPRARTRAASASTTISARNIASTRATSATRAYLHKRRIPPSASTTPPSCRRTRWSASPRCSRPP